MTGSLAELVGAQPRAVTPVSGGDICDGFRVETADGVVFVKRRDAAPASFFRSEALGLEWLAAADAVRVPRVVNVADDALVLEWLDAGRPSESAAESLGRGLARLHRFGAEAFGAPWQGFIGSLPQSNGPFPDWSTMYGEERLLPFAREAVRRGALDPGDIAVIDALVGRLDDLVAAEPPSRIHGDLWSGNLLWGADDQPAVIDPAAHGGHRETDLAMLHLFGAPHLDRVLGAYDEEFPLADGWRQRADLHQVHPLLVHAVLFGGGYGAAAVRAARRYL